MANPWFKFYGSDYLSDTKIRRLDAVERSCWLTLLCWANQESNVVRYVDADVLLQESGVRFQDADYETHLNVLDRFVSFGMITVEEGVISVTNWEKRQETSLTNAERQARYRAKKKDVTDVTTTVTLEEKRVDKKRIEEKESKSLSFLKKLPVSDLTELSEKYAIDPKGIQSKATDLVFYCQQNGRKYKNYRAFLENALRKDKRKLQQEFPLSPPQTPPPEEEELTEEQEEKNRKWREQITTNLTNKFRLKPT